VPAAPGRSAAQRQAGSERAADAGNGEIGPGREQEVAQPDQRAGEQRQGLARLLEHLHDLRHHVHQKPRDDGERDHGDEDRVQQREAGLLAQRLARVQIVGKVLQHGRQRARLLAAMYQGAVELRKAARVAAKRGGERCAGQDFGLDAREHLARQGRLDLFDERRQRLLHRQSGVEQRRHLPREQAQLGRAQPARPGLTRALARGGIVERRRQQAARAQLNARLARRIRLHHPGDGAALGVERLIVEGLHGAIRASRARLLPD
jgi:hypothetical protein